MPFRHCFGDARSVRAWFDEAVGAAEAFQRGAKADNNRIAYRAAVPRGAPGARTDSSRPCPPPTPTSPPSSPANAGEDCRPRR
jgi:hypothetical protein